MAERYHISSAVVAAMPGRSRDLIETITAMAGVEIHGHENSRIIITIEGGSTRDLGDRLTAIAALDGVISANMVFEHVEPQEAPSP